MRNVLAAHECRDQVVNVACLACMGPEGEGVEATRLTQLVQGVPGRVREEGKGKSGQGADVMQINLCFFLFGLPSEMHSTGSFSPT